MIYKDPSNKQAVDLTYDKAKINYDYSFPFVFLGTDLEEHACWDRRGKPYREAWIYI